ncbi:hypothetical protein [Streptosporangium sp. NPDC050280]|uniref:hypothetical protein n=1 Tax=unclassified Streptosporangium TaxID=2632669 RepID=UPI003437BC71
MAKRDKRQPVPAVPKGKSKPVVPGSLAPGAGKPIAPKKLLGVHTNSDDDDLRHPVWRLSLLDREHDGSWSWKIDGATLMTIIEALTAMERLTWREIRVQQAHSKSRSLAKHHAQPVGSLCAEAQKRLGDLGLDDWDELFRFRIMQKGRLWGVLSNESPRVFYPIWWDPEHLVSPVDHG